MKLPKIIVALLLLSSSFLCMGMEKNPLTKYNNKKILFFPKIDKQAWASEADYINAQWEETNEKKLSYIKISKTPEKSSKILRITQEERKKNTDLNETEQKDFILLNEEKILLRNVLIYNYYQQNPYQNHYQQIHYQQVPYQNYYQQIHYEQIPYQQVAYQNYYQQIHYQQIHHQQNPYKPIVTFNTQEGDHEKREELCRKFGMSSSQLEKFLLENEALLTRDYLYGTKHSSK